MNSFHLNRRGLLWRGAGVTLIASGGLTDGCAAASPAAAYAPWRLWNRPEARGTLLALVAAAVLAANPHDTQPWLFHVGGDSIAVYADTSRNLGAMDPFLREMHIGLGCALENMVLAAPANGFSATIEPGQGSLLDLAERRGPVLAATVRLRRESQTGPGSALYAAIPHRHTDRHPYEPGRPFPATFRAALSDLARDPDLRVILFERPGARGGFDAAVIDATHAIVDDAPMIADSDRWFRATSADIEKYRSGPTFEAAGLSPLTLMLAKAIPTSLKVQHQSWIDATRRQLQSAPLGGFIAVKDLYDRSASLAAGRAWQRLHLAATAAGVSMQPLNQPMEVVDRDRQLGRGDAWARRLAALPGFEGWAPTFCFRAGMSAHAGPASPRRALEDVIAA